MLIRLEETIDVKVKNHIVNEWNDIKSINLKLGLKDKNKMVMERIVKRKE